MFSSGSFKKYMDMKNEADDLEAGDRAANDAAQLDRFTGDIDLIKEDVKAIEKLCKRLNEMNEDSRSVPQASRMSEVRARMDSDLEHVVRFAKSIVHRIGGISNFIQPGSKSSIDKTRISVVSGLGKKLRDLMDDFQGLRVRAANVYKETVEFKYFSITGERKPIDAVENLIASGEIEADLLEAEQEHGTEAILDFIDEVHERLEGARNVQRSLSDLHQIFLEATAAVEVQAQKMANGGGGGGNDGGENQENRGGGGGSLMKGGVAQLHDMPVDYDREAKRRATIGLILAVFLVFMIIIPLYVAESNRDQE